MAWKIAYGDLEFRNPGSTTGSKVNTPSTLPHLHSRDEHIKFH